MKYLDVRGVGTSVSRQEGRNPVSKYYRYLHVLYLNLVRSKFSKILYLNLVGSKCATVSQNLQDHSLVSEMVGRRNDLSSTGVF